MDATHNTTAAEETATMTDITTTWAKATTRRMQPGGDLYRRPLTRAEMTAPESWSEAQMGAVHRYGEREDGTIGWVKVR